MDILGTLFSLRYFASLASSVVGIIATVCDATVSNAIVYNDMNYGGTIWPLFEAAEDPHCKVSYLEDSIGMGNYLETLDHCKQFIREHTERHTSGGVRMDNTLGSVKKTLSRVLRIDANGEARNRVKITTNTMDYHIEDDSSVFRQERILELVLNHNIPPRNMKISTPFHTVRHRARIRALWPALTECPTRFREIYNHPP